MMRMLSPRRFFRAGALVFVLSCGHGVYAAQADGRTVPAVSVLCVEAESGLVLSESHADVVRPPASMVKMMHFLLVSEGLDRGQWTLDTPVPVSAHAEYMGGTQVYLAEGDEWPLGHLMQAMAVASANDASMAVAEALWGSEAGALRAMNRRAAQLGMENTRFRSVHGLPPDDGESFDETTARDMALLARECVKHPRIMNWVRTREFRPSVSAAAKYNTNKLLWRMDDCDGLKTGYIRAAGFCIAATAEREGIRLIAVVMGSPSKYGRFNLAEETLEAGFRTVARVPVGLAEKPLGDAVPVELCRTSSVRLAPTEDLVVHVRKQDTDRLRVVTTHPDVLSPPLAAGEVVGRAEVRLGNKTLASAPLAVPKTLRLDGWRLTLNEGVARWEGFKAVKDATFRPEDL